jgi:hypothetical protein
MDGQVQGMGRRYNDEDHFDDLFTKSRREVVVSLSLSALTALSTLRSAWESGTEPVSDDRHDEKKKKSSYR